MGNSNSGKIQGHGLALNGFMFEKAKMTLEFSNRGILGKCKESISLLYLSQSKHYWNTQSNSYACSSRRIDRVQR